MKPIDHLDLIQSTLSSTTKAILLLGSTPNLDSVAAALALSLALHKRGIEVQVACPVDMRVEFNRLVGVDEVKKKIGNRNLVISFDYSEDKVEKVSYTISDDGKRFNLVIAPKSGVLPLQSETVSFSYAGADAQLICLFGINSFEELGELYENEHAIFESAMTIAFNLFPVVPPFAKLHIDASGTSGLSELVESFCSGANLALDEDSASNILAGIDGATNELHSPLATPDTYETVAKLMRAGGKRPPQLSAQPVSPTQLPYVPQESTNPFAKVLGSAQAPQPIMGGEMKG